MFIIKKIKLVNLMVFIQSDEYQAYKIKPISSNRVDSYINNPNGDPNDIVLYLALVNNELAAYRTVLPDCFIIDDQTQRFAWLSGSFTALQHRRKGLSSKLFNEVYEDWNGNLIFNNVAPASLNLYVKSNYFEALKTLDGYRYYRRFCLKKILYTKSEFFRKHSNLIGCLDQLLNYIFDFRFLKYAGNTKLSLQKLTNWDDELLQFLNPYKVNELFQRNKLDFSWILKYPWIKSDMKSKNESDTYNFSVFAKEFNSDFYVLRDNNTNQIIALLLINIRDQHLTIPYAYFTSNATKAIQELISELSYQYKIDYLTIFDATINKALGKKRFYFLFSKTFQQIFMMSKKIKQIFPNSAIKNIQSGDGDQVFV